MCRLCGREACAECFQQVKELTEDRQGASQTEIVALQAKREKHSHTNPFFLACTRRNEHQAKDFSPMSRFCKLELAGAITEMETLIQTLDIDALPILDGINPTLDVPHPHAPQPTPVLPVNGAEATSEPSPTPESNAQIDPALTNPADDIMAADAIPCHTPLYFTDAQLTEDAFRPMWQKGEPMVVVGLLEKFKIQWTPEYFIEKYDAQSCLILECQSDQNKRTTVGEFFSWFGKYEGRTECWKLKVGQL